LREIVINMIVHRDYTYGLLERIGSDRGGYWKVKQ
jgi:predicted HTH transcriptional regulator